MKISTKGRYGLILLVDLACHDAGAPVSLKTIADRQGLSEHYLEQLIAPLRNAGFVKSIRGAYGGYVLARNASDIRVSEIILTLEGPLTIVDEEVRDGLDELWNRLRNCMFGVLDGLSLHDLVEIKQRHSDNFMYYI